MSLSVFFGSFLPIMSGYNSKPLLMAKEQSFLDWENYPVLLKSSEMQSMHFPYIVQILSSSMQSPTKLITLESSHCYPLVNSLNEKYLQVISKYFEELKVACEKDAQKIAALEKRYKGTNYSIPLATGLVATGAMVKLQDQDEISIAKLAGVFAIGVTAGYFFGSHILKTYLQREGSTHRIEWFLKVDKEEKDRLKVMKDDVLRESKKLESELKELEEDGETDIQKEEYAQKLSQLVSFLFPEEKAIKSNV